MRKLLVAFFLTCGFAMAQNDYYPVQYSPTTGLLSTGSGTNAPSTNTQFTAMYVSNMYMTNASACAFIADGYNVEGAFNGLSISDPVLTFGVDTTGVYANVTIDGTTPIRYWFGDHIVDYGTNVRVRLTAGTTNTPSLNYICAMQQGYITNFTTYPYFPTNLGSRAIMFEAFLMDTNAVANGSGYALRSWTENYANRRGLGRISWIGERIRRLPAIWESGVQVSLASTNTATNMNYVLTSEGIGWQMHSHTIPAITAQTNMWIINHPTGFRSITNLQDIVLDASSNAVLAANSDAFAVNVFAFVESGITPQSVRIMLTLSTDDYTGGVPADRLTKCIADSSAYDQTGVPVFMQGMTIRIGRIIMVRNSATTRKYYVYDRRGQPLGTAGGGSSSSGEGDPIWLAASTNVAYLAGTNVFTAGTNSFSGRLGVGTNIVTSGSQLTIADQISSAQLDIITKQTDGDINLILQADTTWVLQNDGNGSQGQTDNLFFRNNDTAKNVLQLYTNGNVLIPSGNVGIGTASPTEQLEVGTTSPSAVDKRLVLNGRQINAEANNIASIDFRNMYLGGTQGMARISTRRFTDNYGTAMDFLTGTPNASGGAQANVRTNMTLNSTGLGIGTNAPAYLLDVNGNAMIRGTNVFLPAVYGNTVTASVQNVYIQSDGQLGGISSSRKYKKNIADTTDADMARLMALRPRKYDRIDGSTDDEVGLIAEEIYESNLNIPHLLYFKQVQTEVVSEQTNAVTYEVDGEMVESNVVSLVTNIVYSADMTKPEGVNYEFVVPLLIDAVKRQQAEINAIKAKYMPDTSNKPAEWKQLDNSFLTLCSQFTGNTTQKLTFAEIYTQLKDLKKGNKQAYDDIRDELMFVDAWGKKFSKDWWDSCEWHE